MALYPTKSLERNSRLSLAMVKNRAEQNNLHIELDHLEKEKRTAIRMLQNDKQCFKLKYSKSNIYADSSNGYISDEVLSKYFIPSFDINEEVLITSIGDSDAKNSSMNFEEIHNMLFTNDEIDKEKVLCLHLVSAHRTESLTPPKKKLAYTCKIHSPLERLLERSKRKNIHLEQKMTNMLPIYTIEVTEFGPQTKYKDLINDGRLATRILLNEKVRELINSVLNALKQSNPDKNYEILEMANDISCLKNLFTKKKILDFVDDLMYCPLINSCESFILTAPFRVKSTQLDIRTISGTLEGLVKQIRQNVLQLPTRTQVKSEEDIIEDEQNTGPRKSAVIRASSLKKMARRFSEEEGVPSKTLEDLYTERAQRRDSDPDKKLGRHVDTNFVKKNINAAAYAKKVEYDSDDDCDYYHRPKRSSQSSSTRSRRRSSDSSNISDRPNIQPIKIPVEVAAIMQNKEATTSEDQAKTNAEGSQNENDPSKGNDQNRRTDRRRSSTSDSEHVKIHLKQTTCPACMERYKIPLPVPKTPRVKPSSVVPLAPGENPDLITNSKNRIDMMINKEMFKLQSYERRFSSVDSRANSLKKKELEACSSSYLNLSPLELARIEQEIKEKETQKKLEKFLKE